MRKSVIWAWLSLAALLAFGCGTRVLVGDDAPEPVTPSVDAGGDAASAAPDASPGFEASPGEIRQTQVLSADFQQSGNGFGAAIARSPSRLVVGAPWEGTATGAMQGAVYIFEKAAPGGLAAAQGMPWLRGQRLESPNSTTSNRTKAEFGTAVAVDDSTIVVGSSARQGAGVVDVFMLRDGWWTSVAELKDPLGHGFLFGCGVALAGDWLTVASFDGLHMYRRVGERFEYTRSERAFVAPCEIAASSTAIIGAGVVPEDADSGGNHTAAFAMIREGNGWGAPIPLGPSAEGAVLDAPAIAVAAEGTRAVIKKDSTIVLFDLASGQPIKSGQFVIPGSTNRSGVALRGDLVGANGRVFRVSSGWAEVPLGNVGFSVDDWVGPDFEWARRMLLDDDGVVVGARRGSNESTTNSGIVVWTDWHQPIGFSAGGIFDSQYVTQADTLGLSIVADGSFAVVEGVSDERYVFDLFEKQGDQWRFKKTLPATGAGVALSGTTLAAGARLYERGSDGIWRGPEEGVEQAPVDIAQDPWNSPRPALEGDRLVLGFGREFRIYERAASGPWLRVWDGSEGGGYGAPTLHGGLLLIETPEGFHAFERSASGDWSDAGELHVSAQHHNPGDLSALIVDGDRVMVARKNDDILEEWSRSGGTWTTSASLDIRVPSALAPAEGGYWVGSAEDMTGAITFVTRDSSGIARGRRLTPAGVLGGAAFGAALAVSTSTLFVAAPGEDRTGRVHVYERTLPSPVR